MRKLLPLICLLAAHGLRAQVPADSSVGVGILAPQYRLDVQTGIDNDGLRLRSIHPGNLRLRLGSVPAAREYSFLVGGPGSAIGNGNFALTDVTRLDSARLLINGTTGHIAIGGGTLNPPEMLTVNGMVQMTGMRLTHNPGVNRIMASDATGMASWQPANALNLPSGSGSFNYITKWTPNGFTLGNSQMVDDGTYVGIGNVTPQYRLDLGTAQDNDGLRLRSTNTGNLRLRFNNAGTNKEYSILLGGSASPYGNGNLVVTDGGNLDSARLLINGTTGNIGIGSNSINPEEKLTVNGTVMANGLKIPSNAGTGKVLTSDANGFASWQAPSAGTVTGSGTLNYIPKWTPNGFTQSNSQIVDDGTFVGIGNVAPQRKLDINSGNYTGINVTAIQVPTLNLTATNTGNTGRELIRFGEPVATPGGLVNAQIGYFRSAELSNARNLILTVDSNGIRPDISISKNANGNVGIGLVNATQKLDVNGTVRATGLLIPTNAGAGKVLTSDAAGNATWQTPAPGGSGTSAVIYSNWTTSPYSSRDTTIDGTCLRIRHIDAPSLSANILNQGMMILYFRVGSIGPYQLPYTSDAGGATNQINCVFNQQKIFVFRHTYNTCRFNTGTPESFPGQPVLINLPQSLEYRYVLIGGTQAGGRMALGPNEHYANSLDAIPDMGAAQVLPGRVYSTVRD
jgi:LysM repeat protein